MKTKTCLKYERDKATGQRVHLYQDVFDEEHVCLEDRVMTVILDRKLIPGRVRHFPALRAAPKIKELEEFGRTALLESSTEALLLEHAYNLLLMYL
jgi:hypothetical protein